MKEILSVDLKIAMKERNEIAIKAIRNLMAAIDNAGAVDVNTPAVMPLSGGIAGATSGLWSTEVQRHEVSEAELQTIIQREIDELEQTIRLVREHASVDISLYTGQIAVLQRYLR